MKNITTSLALFASVVMVGQMAEEQALAYERSAILNTVVSSETEMASLNPFEGLKMKIRASFFIANSQKLSFCTLSFLTYLRLSFSDNAPTSSCFSF